MKADVENKTVTTDKGAVYEYGTLILATGSTVGVLVLLTVASLKFQYMFCERFGVA